MPDAEAWKGVLRAKLAGLLILVCAGARAEDASQPAEVRLTLGTMIVGDTPMLAKTHTDEPARPVWRHTFGAERKTKEVIVRLPKAGFTADVIALQSVTGAAQARQVFPADQYYLVFSRQLLRPNAVEDNATPVSTTAVAVARRPELRALGQEHLMHLAQELGSSSEMTLSAGTAVRLLAGSRYLWVLSVELARGCTEATPEKSSSVACKAWEMQLAEIARWLAAKQVAGEAAVVAGVFHRPLQNTDLPEAIAKLPRVQAAAPEAAACTQAASDLTTSYALLASPKEISANNPKMSKWAFVGPAGVASEASCTMLVDLVSE